MKRIFWALSIVCLAARGAFAADVHHEMARALSLRDCIDTALERSPRIQAADHRWRSARHAAGQADAAMKPSVIVRDTYDRTDRAFNPLFTFPQAQHVGTAELRQSLYSGGKLQSQEEQAVSLAQQARWQLVSARYDVVEQVIRAYLDWLQQVEQNAFFESSRRRNQKLEAEIAVRVEAGKALEAERLQAHIRVLDDERSLLEVAKRADLARARLLAQMNLPEGLLIEAIDDLELLERLPDPGGALGESNAALLASSASVQAALADLERAEGESRPSLDLAVRRTHYFEGLQFSSFDGDFTDYVAVMEFPLFDSGLRDEGEKSARATLEANRKEHRNLELQEQLALRQAILDLTEARRRVEIAEEKKAAAAENHRVARERYDAGTVLLSEVLDAIADVEFASTEAIAARFDLYRSKVTALRLQGRMPELGLLQDVPDPRGD